MPVLGCRGNSGSLPGTGASWALVSPGPTVSSALVCRMSLGKSLEVGCGQCWGLPPSASPSPLHGPGPSCRKGCHYFSKSPRGITLKMSYKSLSPQTSSSVSATVRRAWASLAADHTPQLLTTAHRPLTWVPCWVPPTLRSISPQDQELGTPHRDPHQPLRAAAPPLPGDPGPPAASHQPPAYRQSQCLRGRKVLSRNEL